MKKHLILFLASAWLLAGCGGGGGGTAPSTGAGPSPSSPPLDTSSLRIEPFDPVLTRVSARQAQAPAAPLAAAWQVRLGPMGPQPQAPQTDPVGLEGLLPKARQIGTGRGLPGLDSAAGLQARLSWQPLPGGGQGAALRIQSEGAQALRIALRVDELPPTARLRVFATAGGSQSEMSGAEILAGAGGPRSRDAQALSWLPTVPGADVTLEILLPEGVDPAGVRLAVPLISHLWVDLMSPRSTGLLSKAASACNLDGCQPGWANQARSVAQLAFTDSPGASFLCTGTLLADTARSGTPYLLTARHCISSGAAAATLETYWFKAAAPCDALMPSTTQRASALGARLLFESVDTDTSFLRLLGTPPAGARFAGTLLSAPRLGIPVGVLHHPLGDVLKFAEGAVRGTATCTGNPRTGFVDCIQGDRFLEVGWSRGITEQGSSGSALFTPVGSENYVTGQLYAGRASCSLPDGSDYFGRVDIAYRAGISEWLGAVSGAGCPSCSP